MFRLYEALKERPADQPVTQEDINIASGQKVLDPTQATKYMANLEAASENIRSAFQKQVENAEVGVQNPILLFVSAYIASRDHGTKTSLSGLLLNGLLRVTSPLMNSTSLSSALCLHMLTTHHRASKFLTVTPFEEELWTWVMRRLSRLSGCSRYVFFLQMETLLCSVLNHRATRLKLRGKSVCPSMHGPQSTTMHFLRLSHIT